MHMYMASPIIIAIYTVYTLYIHVHVYVHVYDRAWENRPLRYSFTFHDISTTLKCAIHSMQW